MKGGEGNTPSEQNMKDEMQTYCPKMIYVPGELNVVDDLGPAMCASLKSTPSLRFKISTLAAAENSSIDLLVGEDQEVCNMEVIINEELRSLARLMDQEAVNFRPIVPLPV